jgi:hypothetical protein
MLSEAQRSRRIRQLPEGIFNFVSLNFILAFTQKEKFHAHACVLQYGRRYRL